MSGVDLGDVVVRPLEAGERPRFDAELDEHHWLGHRLVGATMRHVAVDGDGRWLALLGFGAAALSCGPRERHIGWAEEMRLRRLRYVVNNQRLCVLPAGRVPNLASAALGRSLRRLSADWADRWGHRVLAVETFVDPARHVGTCYHAAGFIPLGETSGFARSGGRWIRHDRPKQHLWRPLRRDAARVLAAGFDHPLLADRRRPMSLIDLDQLTFSGLLERLRDIEDHRDPRGVRHELASLLALATAATLAGARSVAAIGEYVADCPQPVLEQLGAKFHPRKRCYIPPHDATLRRALEGVDGHRLDEVVGGWLLDQVRAGRLDEQMLVVALDGKTLRGARDDTGAQVHLFGAMVHGEGVVVGQQQVAEKTNEITAFKPLLQDLDLRGALVTADAMHTQREHARFVVEDKAGHYLFQVKGNQPRLHEQITSIADDQFSEVYEDSTRGHGRIDHRQVRVADVPADCDFPYAAQVVEVYRERADLDDVMESFETSYYITDLPAKDAGPAALAGHTRGHWGIENQIHWVRDVTFDEDRHQLRAPRSSTPRVIATLRNLAISVLRLAGVDNIAAGTRWVSRDFTRAAALVSA